MPSDTYSIGDLARLTGVNVRTIRYYLAQGLIPASGESGPGAHYSEGHLDRLRLTKRLQQQHLPLSEIRRRLAELTDADVSSVLATAEPPRESPTTSALDYVRSVLGAPSAPALRAALAPPAPSAAPPAPAPAAPPTSLPPASSASPTLARFLRASAAAPAPPADSGYAAIGMVSEGSDFPGPPVSASKAPLAMPPKPAADLMVPSDAATTEPRPATEPPAPEQPTTERSQWERLALTPDIELHIRRPLGRLEQRRVERLITIARQVLKEGKP